MSDHVFGKPLTRQFVAYENDNAIPIYSLSSAALYSSLGDAVAQTNAIGSMSSWSALAANANVVQYNLPAVNDPNPSSTRKVWQLWERINYKLSSGGQEQPEYRAIDITRAKVGDSVPGTTITELKMLFPSLTAYLNDPKISDMLDLAAIRMKAEMKASVGQWSSLRNLSETKLALAYLAISMCEDSQWVNTRNENFKQRRDDHEAIYVRLMGSISLPADSDGDGVVDEVREVPPGFRYFPR